MTEALMPKARNDAVDVLRAFAILGVFAVHIGDQFEMYYGHMTPEPLTGFVLNWIMGKSFSLLALCFGLSFYVLMDREAQKGGDFSLRFGWRMVVLVLLGIVHGALYRGDVLTVLGAVGLVMIPFHRIRNNAILITVAAVALLQPTTFWHMLQAMQGVEWANVTPNFWNGGSFEAYRHGSLGDVVAYNLFEGQYPKWWFFLETGRMVQIGALFLIGIVLGRIGFFTAPERFALSRWVWLVVLAAIAFVLVRFRSELTELIPYDQSPVMARALFDIILRGWIDLSVMGVYMLVILELHYSLAKPLFRYLVPVGRMTLSVYVFQAIVWVPVFYGFGLGAWEWLTPAHAFVWGAAFFAAEVVFANLWLRHFYYGPLEWVWRAATYLNVSIPFRKKA